ncbi:MULTISPECIES: N-acetyltransferase [unclassified Sulfurihydrogenibium]|uniref:N-acetyltransferase n=1 Tax=unclassified Sulfurihydrogenibium TaxID=2619248 RepID=UPI00017240AA|nr:MULTISPECIES: N-acetyltransferase [unclassified Sulfurihydrogenibium]ACD65761.1 GCN5-related N-acetyltransferase [Sulfurihydrogenibium sp. YO3AOP1]MBX0311495.1 N-acetyltransferase [Sulfurihydrogenibium sp.]
MKIRKAKVKDATEIFKILQHFALKEVLLPRSLNSIYENIRDFFVCEVDGKIVGVGSLHVYWEDLAEIKSLAVKEEYQHLGIGRSIVQECLNEAKELGIKRVFALTYVPDFFKKIGFEITDKSNFPQKVWTECIHCVKFNDCHEIPVSINLE